MPATGKRQGSARPLASIKWTLAKAAVEFGTDPRTLLKKLELNRQYPDVRGKYRTRQLLDAVYDEQYRLRTAKLAAEADQIRVKTEVRRDQLIPRAEVIEFCRHLATGLRPVIIGMAAPDADKQRAYAYLAELENGDLLHQVRKRRRTKNSR